VIVEDTFCVVDFRVTTSSIVIFGRLVGVDVVLGCCFALSFISTGLIWDFFGSTIFFSVCIFSSSFFPYIFTLALFEITVIFGGSLFLVCLGSSNVIPTTASFFFGFLSSFLLKCSNFPLRACGALST
jgi:hypothetical protein